MTSASSAIIRNHPISSAFAMSATSLAAASAAISAIIPKVRTRGWRGSCTGRLCISMTGVGWGGTALRTSAAVSVTTSFNPSGHPVVKSCLSHAPLPRCMYISYRLEAGLQQPRPCHPHPFPQRHSTPPSQTKSLHQSCNPFHPFTVRPAHATALLPDTDQLKKHTLPPATSRHQSRVRSPCYMQAANIIHPSSFWPTPIHTWAAGRTGSTWWRHVTRWVPRSAEQAQCTSR